MSGETRPCGRHVETIVIGAGQAGLAASYWLTKTGVDHVVIERGRIAEAWRSGRWESFRLVTNNASTQLPGRPYEGADPEGFMPRDDVISYFEAYARSFEAPVMEHTTVHRVAATEGVWHVETSMGALTCDTVVIAAGILQHPHVPLLAERVPPRVQQIHSSSYRRPADLPQGAVLVVGSGQSGTAIADELHHDGRRVFLAVGSNPRIPRRYRGRDIVQWIGQAKLRTLRPERFSQHAHISEPGPRDLAPEALAARGVTLVGHVEGIDGERLDLSNDLNERLDAANAFEAELLDGIDAFIIEAGLDTPPEPRTSRRPSNHPVQAHLDLDRQGVTTIVWATGYRFDFSWIDADAFDATGGPRLDDASSAAPGLYFVGMRWRDRPISAYIGSVGWEAERVARDTAQRAQRGRAVRG